MTFYHNKFQEARVHFFPNLLNTKQFYVIELEMYKNTVIDDVHSIKSKNNFFS